jgi:hypothetical protein
MRDDSGQASVEWIGLVLLLALGLAALVRFAPRADADALGLELLHTIACAAHGGCDAASGGRFAADGGAGARPVHPSAGSPRRMVSVPPLVPIAPRERAPAAPGRAVPERLLRGGELVRRARRNAGVLWRRSWMLCLGYEHVRYGVLHPEETLPRAPVPRSEGLRIVNDCLSPVDLVRDWDLIRGPR